MSCNKLGGTHHNACDCREAYVKRLEAVAWAAEKIVRPGPRQSKENAPLEYALWKALDDLNEPQSGDAPNGANAEEERG